MESVELLDLLEKDEAEAIYKRVLSENEWESVCFNLRTKFWQKVRKEMMAMLEHSPDYFITEH